MDKEQELKRLKQQLNNKDITAEEYELRKIDIEERDRLLYELKLQLDSGEIDGKTYNELSYKIINRSKNEEAKIEDLKNKKEHKDNRLKIHFKVIATITIICAIIFSTISIFEAIRSAKISKHIITDINKQNLPDPIQGTTSGEINVNIDGTDIRIEKLAGYTIYGKVVAIHNYTLKNTLYEKLSPVDFTIAYGEGIEFAEKFNFTTNSDRMVGFNVKNTEDTEWFNSNLSYIMSKISNNHVIYANEETKDLLLQVRVGDYVKMEGYLVNVYSDKYPAWNSSLSRDDTISPYMNPIKKLGYCEIIYVTEINWIE